MPRPCHHITDQYRLIKRKGSERWYLEWRENGEPVRRPTGTASLSDALVRARELILAGAMLRREEPVAVGLLDVLDRYYLLHGRGLASASSGKRAITLWRLFWGNKTVSDVTIDEQERFVKWMRARKLSQGYIRRVLATGKSALNRAWKRDEIKQVPFVALPPIGEAYPHYASRAQLVTFLNTPMPEHMWTYCMIRLCTGCRGDAARDLQPFQIDASARLIRLNPPGREQTKKYRPIVPLCDALAKHLATLPAAMYFVNWKGARVESVRTTWRKLRTAADLPAWFAPKVLRHTVATEMRRRGVPGWEASGLLGHRTGGTTEIYAKFDPAYLGKARKAVDAWMRDLAKDVPRLSGVSRVVSAKKPENQIPPERRASAVLQVVGGTGFEPVTPTMSRYRDINENNT